MSSELEDLGWNHELEAELSGLGADPATVARVVADHGMLLRVLGPGGDRRLPLSGAFHAGIERPAVGDFVIVAGEGNEQVIAAVVSRRTQLVRQAAGSRRAQAQVVGANLDVVCVVTALDDDFSVNRVERYITAIREGGATAVVVLNKADLVDDPESVRQSVAERLGDVKVCLTSARDGHLDELTDVLRPRETVSFVGSSGVGKSSIVNALLGVERLAVQEVRSADSKGRHTTTTRELIVLPNGAIVMDTPGMREFQLWDGPVESFDDVEDLAEQCRFRNCGHDREPGCAVRQAVEDGVLDAARYASFLKLSAESAARKKY